MSLTLVNAMTPVILTGGTSPRTTTFDAGTMTNGLLLIAITTQDVDDSVTAVTWNGVSMTALGVANSGQINSVYLFGLVSPDNGSQTISITYSGDGTFAGTVWGASYSASGTPTLGTPVTNSGTGTTASTGSVTCPSGGDVAAVMHHNFSSTDPTLTSSGTSDLATRASNKPYAVAHHNATLDFTWGTLSSSQLWGAIGVPISYGGGGGSSIPAIFNHYRKLRA